MPAELCESGLAARERRPARAGSPEFKGWHALALLVGFFAIIATMNGVMLTYAVRTMPGLDARNGYDPSQRFNAELKLAGERVGLGLRADAGVSLVDGEARLLVVVRSRDGATVDGLQASAVLRHPADRRRDRTIPLEHAGGGRYVGKASGISVGAWDLVIEARSGGGAGVAFASSQRIDLGS